ncbi:MAG: glycosyltransferase family 39 protein [Caldilineaceae bacterium]|nr:glycosyltransferase family 39 protein [Caldilineaceae bacterium]
MLTAQRKKLLSAVGLALIAQALLFVLPASPFADWVRVGALLLWAAFIPGHLLVEVVGRDFGAPATKLEWGIYALGGGYTLLLALLLLLSYLPGPLPGWYLHIGVDVVLLVLLVAAWPIAGEEPLPQMPLPRWEVVALFLILALAALLRLTNIGYAEFHGDEARAVLRAAAVIQGYDDVLFLHKKGPGEILIPTAIFAALGNLTETTARLPFAIANLTALATIFWLGRRLLGPIAGLAAALLLAVDGFYIGFARIVQYQSLVILLSALALLVLVRLWQEPRALWRGLLLAALFVGAGLWAHYEAGLVAFPALFAIGVLWTRYPVQRRALIVGLIGALALGALLLALFYVPYFAHEQFSATYTYLVDRRIAGEGFPVNNIADLWLRLTTYSSSYYALAMIGLLLGALLALYRRALGGWGALVAGGALVIFVTLTIANPSWATVGGRDWWVLLALLALLPAWFLPRTRAEERLLWIWFGALLIILLGFTSKPRTHVYTFFAPWSLLAGMVVQRVATWWAARPNVRPRNLAWTGAAIGLVVALLFGGYVYQMFAYTRVEILHTWNVNWPRGYWRPYAVLDNDALFGFPLTNGWKAVGELYADGTLSGDYATNEIEYWAPIWYTHGRMRCDERAAYFFQISNHQADPEGYARTLATQLLDRGYQPWATVTLHDEARMLIHQRTQAPLSPQRFALEKYVAAFDAAATPNLPLGYPVVEPPIPHPLDANLGGLIRLEGYALDAPTPLQPGATVQLTLYWRALQEIDLSYKVFIQSYYGDGVMVAQQDGYPVCGGRGTWLWDPGEQIVDVHQLTIQPAAPDGLYPLYVGLYIEETLDRLNVVDAAGQPVGDRVHLTDLRIGVE